MHTDAGPSGTLSLRRIVIASAVALLLCGASASRAQEDEPFHLSVSPNPATTLDPLVATVNVPNISCAFLGDPVVADDYGAVWIPLSLQCPPPPGDTFPAHVLLDPLPAGIWDIQLVSADLPSHPPTVIDSVLVTVTDPRFSVQLAPSPATETDVVVAHITGEGMCAYSLAPVIEEGRIRLGVGEVGICDPPPPIAPFELDQIIGQLDVGEYLVELFYDDLRVAENMLHVLPAGSCVPGPTTLCLSRGRFRVEATWSTPSGLTGAAQAVEETDGSGLFWFRNPDSIELVVKVIDACALTQPSFWVFAGGVTNVGVLIEVTDTWTGEIVRYDNPVGQPFETILDTGAFLGCP